MNNKDLENIVVISMYDGGYYYSIMINGMIYVFHPIIYKRIVDALGYNPSNSDLVKIIARGYPMYRRQYTLHAYNFKRDYYGN